MKYLGNEVKLDALTDQDQLTNLRITQGYNAFLKASYKNSIFLENISSIEVRFKSKILYLISGLVFLILSIYSIAERAGWLSVLSFIVGATFIAIFFFTRKHVISITPDGGKSIDITVKGISKSRIEEYITNINEAKLARTANISK